MIRQATPNDATALSEIYNHYVLNTVVTFEEQAVSPSEMLQRVQGTQDDGLPWLVAEQDQNVVGFAYASKWKTRSAYRHTVEVTVYLSDSMTTKGIGSELYTALFNVLKEQSVHVVLGGISLPNQASIALHEKFGMAKVAHFEQVGYKFDRWVDVAYWQGKL